MKRIRRIECPGCKKKGDWLAKRMALFVRTAAG
jgi:hypothetical protein